MTTRPAVLASCLLGAVALTGCGGATEDDPRAATSSSVSGKPTEEAPSYDALGKAELTSALLKLQDLPPGYSQDADEPEDENKTFCDYRPPFNEKVKVSRTFTKGGGLSSEFLAVGLRQYANAKEASAAFDALGDALQTCKGETIDGSEATYAQMSTPKVGDGTIGVKIELDNATVLQNFALAGPTLISTGGGGLVNADADEVSSLLEAQVKSYAAAARG